MKCRRRVAAAAALSVVLTLSLVPLRVEGAVEIKIATVAPRGSAWMRLFNKLKAKLLKATGGEVKLRFYPGQVQGDERDVVRKMRTGQLHGGALTAVGLSQVNPEVLVLQMPTMFKDEKSLDRARGKLRDEFAKTFTKRGYVLLGWGDVGPIYLFSTKPITSIKELKKQKVWAWTDDPISKALLRKVGISPRLLGLPQVLPSLNTGIINTVFGSPLALLALQWHTKVKYMSARPFAVGIGATVISKKVFDKIKPEHRKVFLELCEKYHRAVLKRSRRDNKRALEALHKSFGIKSIAIPAAGWNTFLEASKKVMRAFVPRYYSNELLKKVLAAR